MSGRPMWCDVRKPKVFYVWKNPMRNMICRRNLLGDCKAANRALSEKSTGVPQNPRGFQVIYLRGACTMVSVRNWRVFTNRALPHSGVA